MFSLRSPLIIVCENTWRIQRSYAHENYKKTMQAVYYCFHRAGKQWTSNTFSWHSPLVILWGKCLEDATFARSGKLWKNAQENMLYTSVFVEQENNRKTSCFHGIHR